MLFSFSAYSQGDEKIPNNTYLCISEETAQIIYEGNRKFSSASGKLSKKYIITQDNGLKELGKDYVWLNSCYFNKEGVPTSCESGSKGWAGKFFMHSDNTFVVSGVWSGFKENKKEKVFYWIAGSCSKL